MEDFEKLKQKFNRPYVLRPPVGHSEPPPAVKSVAHQPQPAGRIEGGPARDLVVRVGADLRIKLAELPEPVLAAIERQLSWRNPRHRRRAKSGVVHPDIPKYLKAYYHHGEDLVMARGWASSLMRILQSHRISGKYEDHTVEGEKSAPFAFQGKLYGYQMEAVGDCMRRRFGYLTGNIGCGKKVAAFYLMARMRVPTVVMVRYRWQLYQWAAMAARFLKDGDNITGIMGGGRKDTDRPLIIGTDKSLQRLVKELSPKVGLVIVDRCEEMQLNGYFKVLHRLPCYRMLGLAAAKKREDGLTGIMQAYMGPPLHHIRMERVQQELQFTPPELVTYKTAFEYDYQEDFSQMITAVARDEARNRQVATDILAETADPKARALVVCERKEQMAALKEILDQNYREAAAVSARFSDKQVKEILHDFNQKGLQVICVTARSIHRIESDYINRLIMASPVAHVGHVSQAVAMVVWSRRPPGRIVDYLDAGAVLQGTYQRRVKVYQGFNVGTRPS